MEQGEELVAEMVDESDGELLPQQLWAKVCEAINSVLDGHKYYGFLHFSNYADPSIEVIVERSRALLKILDVVIGSPYLGTDADNNMLINCRQSVHLIERTHASLQNGDAGEYESCIRKLNTQRQH